MPTVAEMIQSILAHGMSNEAIAQAVGKSTQSVHNWATGKANPRREALEGIEALYRSVVVAQAAAVFEPAASSVRQEDDAVQTPRIAPRSASDSDMSVEVASLPDRRASPPPRTESEAFRFIHCADLHIDSPLKGLQKIDPRYAEWIRTATREAFKRLVDMAIDDRVKFVVIAGDLYDSDWKSADTGIFVSRQLKRLADAGIRVFAITGNHDALSVVTRSVSWPETAYQFTENAESVEVPDIGVLIHGRSFGDRHESEDFISGYPPPQPGLFNIGLLHTSLGGAAGHAKYAPCSPAQLSAIGYDYWALGHVHVPKVVQSEPHIVYSGNIQGRDIGETGPRGCYVVTVDAARKPTVHFVDLDDVRWERIEVDLGVINANTEDDVVAAAIDAIEARIPADERLLACRVVLTGETPLHRRLITRRGSLRESVAESAGSQLERVCVEQIAAETSDPQTTPQPHADVPGRARDLLEDEFRKLQSANVDAVLGDVPELKKLFDDLRLIDSVKTGQRSDLQAPNAWAEFVAEARNQLAAELAGSQNAAEVD
jgi:exonuclease SbcD